MKKAVIINDTSYDMHHGCNQVMKNLINLLNKNNFNVIKKFGLLDKRSNVKNVKKYIIKADYLFINGEGTIHDGNGYVLMKLAKYAKKKNKKVFLLNTIYINNPKKFDDILSTLDLVVLRDSHSYKNAVIHNKNSYCAMDLSMYGTFKYDLHKRKDHAVTDSILPEVTKSLYAAFPNRIRLVTRSNNLLKTVWSYMIDDIMGSFFLNIRLIQFLIRRHVLFLLKNREAVLCETSLDYIKTISSKESIICGRFHSMCFSLVTRTPFLGVESNTPKMTLLLQDVGLSDRMINLRDLKDNTFPKKFTKKELFQIDLYLRKGTQVWDYLFIEKIK